MKDSDSSDVVKKNTSQSLVRFGKEIFDATNSTPPRYLIVEGYLIALVLANAARKIATCVA